MGFQTGASLILGGARSGKSTFAEQLAQQSGRGKIYVATSEIHDKEMEARVALHKSRRGDEWQLIEEPRNLVEVLENHSNSGSCILIDCLTLWLTNLMIGDAEMEVEIQNLVQALTKLEKGTSVLLVSNEVGQGIVPIDKMAREFRDYAGTLHQEISAVVPNVWFVTAGIPQKLK